MGIGFLALLGKGLGFGASYECSPDGDPSGDGYDVQDLITTVGLPLEMAERLDASVRAEYVRLWQTVHP